MCHVRSGLYVVRHGAVDIFHKATFLFSAGPGTRRGKVENSSSKMDDGSCKEEDSSSKVEDVSSKVEDSSGKLEETSSKVDDSYCDVEVASVN